MFETRITAADWCAAPSGPRQPSSLVGPLGLRAEHVGRGVEHRSQLRVAVALALDRLGVEPERHVVDEHAAVDLGQVDPALPAGDESVEGADDVVAVDPQVEREVVAGAGRDAGERQVVLGRDRGDERLGAVTARRREPVGASGHGVTNELLEVVAGLQLDRLDPARPRLVGQVVADGLASAGPRVPHHDRALRRLGGREHRVDREHPPGNRDAHQEERYRDKSDTEAVARAAQRRPPRRAEARRRPENVPHVTPPPNSLPRRHRARDQQRDHHETTGEVADDLDDGRDDGGHEEHQRHRSCHPPADQTSFSFPLVQGRAPTPALP